MSETPDGVRYGAGADEVAAPVAESAMWAGEPDGGRDDVPDIQPDELPGNGDDEPGDDDPDDDDPDDDDPDNDAPETPTDEPPPMPIQDPPPGDAPLPPLTVA